MATFRSDHNSLNSANSNFSTNRMINENETANKFNQFKRNVNSIKTQSQDYTNNSNKYTNNNYSNFNQMKNNQNFQQELFGSPTSQHFTPNIEVSSNNGNFGTSSCNFGNLESEKFINLKNLYDERIRGLYQEIKLSVSKLENDEILQTMKKDAISSEYITERIHEVLDENLHLEKEETIKRLNYDLADAKTKVTKFEQINYELNNKLKTITTECDNKINIYEQKLLEYQKSQEMLANDFNNVQSSMQSLGSTYDIEMKKMVDDCNVRLMKQSNELSKNKIEIANLNSQLQV